MDIGGNEWLQDIREQTKRLASLTNDLIYLSRMEEEQIRIEMLEFPFSDLVTEVAQSFQAPAKRQEKEFSLHVRPMLSLCGNEKELRQLVSILLDNALKYSEQGGTVSLSLERQGKTFAFRYDSNGHIPRTTSIFIRPLLPCRPVP